MAFVLDQTWNASVPCGSAAGGTSVLAPLLSGGRDRHARRAGAILFSILVHIVLLWMLLNKLAGGAVGEGDGAGAGSGTMMSFTLSDPASATASAQSEPEQVAQPRVELAAVSDVDATVPTDLPPPEWTVSRLPPSATPRPAAASGSALASASTGAGASGAGAGAGRGGNEVYDPYAGAAPMRRDSPAAATGSSLGARVLGFLGLGDPAAAGLSLDQTALEVIRSNVERSLPGKRGTAEIMVRVSPTGMVLEASARGGSAPAEAMLALRRALIGKRLFSGTATNAQMVTLPVLRLG